MDVQKEEGREKGPSWGASVSGLRVGSYFLSLLGFSRLVGGRWQRTGFSAEFVGETVCGSEAVCWCMSVCDPEGGPSEVLLSSCSPALLRPAGRGVGADSGHRPMAFRCKVWLQRHGIPPWWVRSSGSDLKPSISPQDRRGTGPWPGLVQDVAVGLWKVLSSAPQLPPGRGV